MRFLVDRCAGRRAAEWLRSQGHDVVETRERGADPGDEVVLEWAASEERILITMDKDFGALIFARGAAHAGVIRLPHVRSHERIALLESIFARHGDDELKGAIVTVRGSRIRISASGR